MLADEPKNCIILMNKTYDIEIVNSRLKKT